jgi:large subunit ribosomal protein L15
MSADKAKTTKPAAAKAKSTKTTDAGGGKETAGVRTLGNLRPNAGSHRSTKRLGRGIGSGLGKTAGKGHKGQLARKGADVRGGFEGGQMPLYRRLPKRGFKNPFRVEFNVINLDTLEHRFDNGASITPATLLEHGLIRFSDRPVKVLGRGAVNKKFKLSVHKASEAARIAVEKAGGSVEFLTMLPQPESKAVKAK